MIEIRCKNIRFYSEEDELIFFEWLRRIKVVKEICGKLNIISLRIKSRKISDRSLRELLAIFYRYKIDMKELAQFLNEDNKAWFRENSKAYWHERVFKKEKGTVPRKGPVPKKGTGQDRLVNPSPKDF